MRIHDYFILKRSNCPVILLTKNCFELCNLIHVGRKHAAYLVAKSFGYITGLNNNYFNEVKALQTKVTPSQRNGKDNAPIKSNIVDRLLVEDFQKSQSQIICNHMQQ